MILFTNAEFEYITAALLNLKQKALPAYMQWRAFLSFLS